MYIFKGQSKKVKKYKLKLNIASNYIKIKNYILAHY